MRTDEEERNIDGERRHTACGAAPGGPTAGPAAIGVEVQRFFGSFSSGGFFFRRFLPSTPLLLSRMSVSSCARHPWAGPTPVQVVFALRIGVPSKGMAGGLDVPSFRHSGD